MRYRVRLTERASRDLEAIYEFIEADTSDAAFAWFNGLAEVIYSLERLPERGTPVPENKKLRQLLFGQKPDTYKVIYKVEKRNRVLNVLHVRHGARAAITAES
jgi:plasmid stabilization system protein ParE